MRPLHTMALAIAAAAFVFAGSSAFAVDAGAQDQKAVTPDPAQPDASALPLRLAFAGTDQPQAQQDQAAQDDANDPLEGMNRAFFHSSLVFDRYLIRPAAVSYRHIFSQNMRNSVRNLLNNLNSPPIFVNELLQGEFDEAGTTVLRFAINSTVGCAGLMDIADRWGLPRHTEDFGQTLGSYGVGEGPYLFLPLVGPAPPRDLTGQVVDIFFDPVTYVHMGNQNYWRFVRITLDAVDLRERNIETLDEIERTSVDYYASVRSLYRQTRNNEIRNNKTDIQNLPEF